MGKSINISKYLNRAVTSAKGFITNKISSHIGNLEDIDGKEILHMLASHKLPSYESISRCRRKIQEKKPHLRGEKWDKRHGRAKEIRREIAR